MTQQELNNVNKLIQQEIDIQNKDIIYFIKSSSITLKEESEQIQKAFKIFLDSDDMDLKKQWFEIKNKIVLLKESYDKEVAFNEEYEQGRWYLDHYGHEDLKRLHENLAPHKEKIKKLEKIIVAKFT